MSATYPALAPATHQRTPIRKRSPDGPLRSIRYTPLQLWHLLSLDAPTVAVLWTAFFARAHRIHLPLQLPAAMALAVWLLYAADRLLDARIRAHTTCRPFADLQARHLFHHDHRRPFLAAMTAAALFLAALASTLPHPILRLYLFEAAILAAWFLLIHATSLLLPKELAVGLFFAATVLIPTLPAQPSLLPSLLFAGLCTLNCLFIQAWEHPSPTRAADLHSRFARYCLPTVAVILLATSAALHTRPTLAIAVSTALLLLLHAARHRLLPTTLRAAADLALLTPLLFLW